MVNASFGMKFDNYMQAVLCRSELTRPILRVLLVKICINAANWCSLVVSQMHVLSLVPRAS
jgi:hypothetical protein